MPFPFSQLVNLLEPLSDLSTKVPTPKPAILRAQCSGVVSSWFDIHRTLFTSTNLDPIALFSLLFPELRCDRVYGFKEDGLVKIIARCLRLGITRQRQLSEWRIRADGDLGEMVERVMKQAENPPPMAGSEVTVEEVEKALETLSSRSIFSSQSKRNIASSSSATVSAHELLGPIYLRLTSREGKWLTRAILKSYLPVVVPEYRTMAAYHFLLPHLFAFQNDLRRALKVLSTPVFKIFPPNPNQKDVQGLLEGAMRLIQPEVGVRIRRVGFLKARVHIKKSIKNDIENKTADFGFRVVKMQQHWQKVQECLWRESMMEVNRTYQFTA